MFDRDDVLPSAPSVAVPDLRIGYKFSMQTLGAKSSQALPAAGQRQAMPVPHQLTSLQLGDSACNLIL